MTNRTSPRAARSEAPSLRERAGRLRDAAGRFIKRAAALAEADQPEQASLPEGKAAGPAAGTFSAPAASPDHAGRGRPEAPERDRAEGGCEPRREHDMGRHESFDPSSATPMSLAAMGTVPAFSGSVPGSGPTAPFSSAHPDAALLALKARWHEIAAEYEAACLTASDLEGIGHPPAPDALFNQAEDCSFGISVYSDERHDGRRWYVVEAADAERRRLRRRFWRWEERIATDADAVSTGDTIVRRVPWPEAQSRADEIVSAWDEWQAAKVAADEASGEAEASRTARRLGKELLSIEHELEAAMPCTLDGLAALASYAQVRIEEDEQDDGLGEVLARAILAVAKRPQDPFAAQDAGPPLVGQIVATWREWATQPDDDMSAAGEARYERFASQRDSLLDAAEALPATLENVPAKALASAWLEYVAHWSNGQPRDAYGIDGRLALDIDTAICGRLKTTYLNGAA